MINELRELERKASEYLEQGGFFNPEAMDHDKVRDLIISMRNALPLLLEAVEGLRPFADFREVETNLFFPNKEDGGVSPSADDFRRARSILSRLEGGE